MMSIGHFADFGADGIAHIFLFTEIMDREAVKAPDDQKDHRVGRHGDNEEI